MQVRAAVVSKPSGAFELDDFPKYKHVAFVPAAAGSAA